MSTKELKATLLERFKVHNPKLYQKYKAKERKDNLLTARIMHESMCNHMVKKI
jgi:hypothetical protein